MFRWTNEKFRALVELLGGVAVLGGLIFVGLELRQNTEAVQASTLQSVTEQSQQFTLLLATDYELQRKWLAGASGGELDDVEQAQVYNAILAQWLRFQSAFLQWQRGTMSNEDWGVYETFVCAEPGTSRNAGEISRRRTWSELKPSLTLNFVAFVEDCWADDAE